MPSTQARSMTAPMAEERSQYQHFIPRLILRGFAQDPNATTSSSVPPALSKKKRNKRKKDSRDGVLHFIDLQDGKLGSGIVSRHCGMIDMYRDMDAVDQHGLEKKLSVLEAHAGELLARARKTFLQPGASLTITRHQKDTLRKFLFIMKYRNSLFSSRFGVATIDDYTADDKEKLRDYMQSKGFQSPREVWLANIHAFIDLKMDSQRNWHSEIQRSAYQDDALLFILHVDQSYMAFCKPQCTDDEFLLTENVFGIFEGPNSLAMKPVTGGMARGVWTEWHNFAPVSASLLIILRNNHLPGNIGAGADSDKIYRLLLSVHPFPERAMSMLQDLPVRRCTNSYSTVKNGVVVANPNYRGPSSTDQYKFECFQLDSPKVDLINSLFLEEGLTGTSVTYRSGVAIARAIRTYLEDPRPGFKAIHEDNSPRRRYLGALETALRALGCMAKTSFDTIPLPSMEQHPWDYGGHMARWVSFSTAAEILDRYPRLMECYRSLGGRVSTEQHCKSAELGVGTHLGLPDAASSLRWFEDVEQAGKIAFLQVKIAAALSVIGASDDEKWRCQAVRREFYGSLHPRYIWMYIKVMRNLASFNIDDFKQQIMPLRCEGWEDNVIRTAKQIPFATLSTVLVCEAYERD